MAFWRKKKYIFVIEPKKKETKKERGRFVKVRGVLIALLALFIVVSSVEHEKNRLKRRQAAVDILRLRESADQYLWEHGKCPDGPEDLVKGGSAGGKKKMDGIVDPWGKRYELVCPGKKNIGTVDIISAGPDRSFYTVDDVKI
jgi:hypothetical protein